MTTQPYTPQSVSGYFPNDIFNTGAPLSQSSQGFTRPRFQSRIVRKDKDGDVVQWRVIIEDLRGGLNFTAGSFEQGYDRIEHGLAEGNDVTTWEDFWVALLREYEQVCDELQRDLAA